MTEPANVPSRARLDELAAVTKEYAAYAHARCGLALVVAGAWSGAVFGIAMASEPWGRVAGMWAPAVTVAALVAGKRYYQRFGAVTDPRRPQLSARVQSLLDWSTTFIAAAAVALGAIRLERWRRDGELAYTAAALALFTIPILIKVRSRLATRDAAEASAATPFLAMFLVTSFTDSSFGWLLAKLFLGLFAFLGLLQIALGIAEHVQYRRLRARLAALGRSA